MESRKKTPLLAGFVIYFGYGIRNSTEGVKRRLCNLPEVTDVDMASEMLPEFEDPTKSSSSTGLSCSDPMESNVWERRPTNSNESEKWPLLGKEK